MPGKELKYKGSNLGKRIKKSRESKGLSQRQLALISGISQASLARVEQGNQNITLPEIEQIGRAVERSAYWLIHGEEEPETTNDMLMCDDTALPEDEDSDDNPKSGANTEDYEQVIEPALNGKSGDLFLTIKKDSIDYLDLCAIAEARETSVDALFNEEVADLMLNTMQTWISQQLTEIQESQRKIDEASEKVNEILKGCTHDEIQKILSSIAV